MPERFADVGDIRIWSEDFGRAGDPPILLISGGTSQGITWPQDFIDLLVTGDRHVIRYDHRDTGLSTYVDFGARPYTLLDLTADAVGVLDAYRLAGAHLVGVSMGGMIAQQMAIDVPERVLTITCIASSPAGADVPRAVFGEDAGDNLPPPTPEVVAAGAATRADMTREARIAAKVALYRTIVGTIEPFDEQRFREQEERVESRTTNPKAAQNHALALMASPGRRHYLKTISAPTLVIHGTADPVFPLPHGVAISEEIPGARLITVEGMGHGLPRVAFGRIATAILEHTA